MVLTLALGESVHITRRVVTEEMRSKRVALGFPLRHEVKDGAEAGILRAYPRPRGQAVVRVEVARDGSEVTVTGMAAGFALVDVIDELSEPFGTDYEVYVEGSGREAGRMSRHRR